METKLMLDRILKRILSPKRIAYLVNLAYPEVEKLIQARAQLIVKQTIHETLQDPEIGEHVVSYTDAIYNRYLGKGGKLWASIGGQQKGLNNAIEGINPLSQFVDEEGNISIAKGVKSFLLGAITQQSPQQAQNRQTSSNVF